MLERILAPVDFSRASATGLEVAAGLARRFGAEFTVLLVEDATEPLPASAMSPDCERLLSEFVDKTIGAGSGASIDVTGHPVASEGIVDYARDGAFDWICMATAGVRGWRRLVLGSVASEVMRLSPVPVMLIGRRDKTPALGGPCHVLAAVDLGPLNDNLLRTGAALAGDGGELTVLHVIDTPHDDEAYGVSLAPPAARLATAKRHTERRLRDLLAGIDSPEKRTIRVLDGPPDETILAAAREERPHAIVVGTHGRKGIDRLLLGSVAQRIVRMAEAPVLVIPTLA